MGRNKIEYTDEQLNRPVNFMLVIADRNLDTSIIDIQECKRYVKEHERRALIVSDRSGFEDVRKIKFNLIMNTHTPGVLFADIIDKPYTHVYQRLLKLYKNGLLICDMNTLNKETARLIATTRGVGLDVVMYRPNLVQLSKEEIARVNFIRIHYSSDITWDNNEYMSMLSTYYGPDESFGILLSQYITYYQYQTFMEYFNAQSKKYTLAGYKDYVNQYEHDRQSAFCVYFDVVNCKIIGVRKNYFKVYVAGFAESLKLGLSEKDIDGIVENYHQE